MRVGCSALLCSTRAKLSSLLNACNWVVWYCNCRIIPWEISSFPVLWMDKRVAITWPRTEKDSWRFKIVNSMTQWNRNVLENYAELNRRPVPIIWKCDCTSVARDSNGRIGPLVNCEQLQLLSLHSDELHEDVLSVLLYPLHFYISDKPSKARTCLMLCHSIIFSGVENIEFIHRCLFLINSFGQFTFFIIYGMKKKTEFTHEINIQINVLLLFWIWFASVHHQHHSCEHISSGLYLFQGCFTWHTPSRASLAHYALEHSCHSAHTDTEPSERMANNLWARPRSWVNEVHFKGQLELARF